MLTYELYEHDNGTGYRILIDGVVNVEQQYAPSVSGNVSMTSEQAEQLAQAQIEEMLNSLPPEELAELPKTETQKKIEALEAENTDLKLALAELAESQEADKLTVQLALAELAEIITGGA